MICRLISKTIVLFSLMTCSFFAASEFVTIENFRLWSNTYETETIRVEVVQGYINPSTCSDSDSYMVSSSLDGDIEARIYSTLLSAVMSNKPITLWVDGCERNRPAILNVIVD